MNAIVSVAIPGQPWTWGYASGDFETFSMAGYVWNADDGRWRPPKGTAQFPPSGGLGIVGAAVYTEHPSARVLTFSYRLPVHWIPVDADGRFDPTTGIYEKRGGYKARWKPGEPNPQDLFDYLAAGGLFEAFNVMFERLVWFNICRKRYGWPDLEPHRYQLRCLMATARVNSFPGKLASLGEVLRLAIQKDKDGNRLLKKFSQPQNPTKKNPALVIMPEDDPIDFEKLRGYCDTDRDTEDEASGIVEPMTNDELTFWWVDQEINWRGVAIDRKGVQDCIAVLEQALVVYGDECRKITGFDPNQLAELRGWLGARGVHLADMKEETLDDFIPTMAPHPPGAVDPRRRVLEIRQLIGSASVKKLYAMNNQGCADDRLRNLIVHHGARTGRPTGEGPQPLNLPKAGPDLLWCGGCARPFRTTLDGCPWCGASAAGLKKRKWSAAACQHVLDVMAHRSLELVEWYFGDALLAISGCIRGLFVAGPGNELIASDFSAIEAVVTAMLSGCAWRQEVFRSRKDIYLMSAAKITGRTMEEYEAYLADHGENHPDRQKIGKVAELALGFMGWIAAWRQFDKTDTFSDDQVKGNILAWRDASPEIVELAGGQTRRDYGNKWEERFGFEGAAVNAISFPGQVFTVAGVDWWVENDCLKVRLLSGRIMKYWYPRLVPSTRSWAPKWEMSIVYWTWNTNTKYGPIGWVAMSTYAGKLIENVVQAIAHDILRFAILNLRAAGYPCVLHVYDEIVLEVKIGQGSVEEVERIMGIMPPWAAGWPIRAGGGWRGFRYRKG